MTKTEQLTSVRKCISEGSSPNENQLSHFGISASFKWFVILNKLHLRRDDTQARDQP